MKTNTNDRSGNYLFALNVFIAFLLLFHNKLSIPLWLQPVGRMHTMVLHFPIVLLMLSMVMEFFRSKIVGNENEFYRRFTSGLLLAGVVASGITVIMGIFLSQEAGYSHALLSRHRMWGASVFFTSSVIYAVRNSQRYKGALPKLGAVAVTASLVFAGHFGGALTHGDNFIWKPVMVKEAKVIPLAEARVFDEVIKPVFEQKCLSCHNAEKMKGQLTLTDSLSIVKGGKTGKLFVAGKPELSLLVKRIHLPLDEKKHMPPSGKTQLTVEEQALLMQWIKSGVAFGTRVMALAESDSMRILAEKIFNSAENHEEVFPFPAVTLQTLQNLNSNYRVITPLSKNSPALAVNIYNKASYTPQALVDLKEVELQIISLDLGKMPVKDEDLQYVTRFENLRRLNLNFTEVTGAGIQNLSKLKDLQQLSLSGTNVDYNDVRNFLSSCKNLQTLAIWNTAVSAPEIKRLQSDFRGLSILGGITDDTRPLIKLNPPKLKNKALVFDDSISVDLFHPVKNVDIRFTTNGAAPDSLTSPMAEGPRVLKTSTVIRARAYKAGWLSSDVATLNVYRSGITPDTAILLSKLDRVHPANGAKTFFDHQLGSFNANSPAWANNWAGFIGHDMELLLEFKTPKTISSIAMNTLIETENFIFPPASIEIWGGVDREHLQLISKKKPELPGVYLKPYIQLVDCSFKPTKISYLRIIAKPVMKLPSWHKAKDKPALLLVDEMFIN